MLLRQITWTKINIFLIIIVWSNSKKFCWLVSGAEELELYSAKVSISSLKDVDLCIGYHTGFFFFRNMLDMVQLDYNITKGRNGNKPELQILFITDGV